VPLLPTVRQDMSMAQTLTLTRRSTRGRDDTLLPLHAPSQAHARTGTYVGGAACFCLVLFVCASSSVPGGRRLGEAEAVPDGAPIDASSSASAQEASQPAAAETPPGCRDRSPKCGQWASIGECSRNARYMQTACPLACGTCPKQASASTDAAAAVAAAQMSAVMQAEAEDGGSAFPVAAQDKNKKCGEWAAKGECARNPRYMGSACKRSCAELELGRPAKDES